MKQSTSTPLQNRMTSSPGAEAEAGEDMDLIEGDIEEKPSVEQMKYKMRYQGLLLHFFS